MHLEVLQGRAAAARDYNSEAGFEPLGLHVSMSRPTRRLKHERATSSNSKSHPGLVETFMFALIGGATVDQRPRWHGAGAVPAT